MLHQSIGGHMFQQKKIFLALSQALSVGVAATLAVTSFGQTPQTPPPTDGGTVTFGGGKTVAVPPQPPSPATTEKTVVTGTNVRSVFEEQTLPVIVITREDLEKSAALNMEQLVQQIAQVSTAGSITGSTLAGQ